jgi:hypothetical protein
MGSFWHSKLVAWNCASGTLGSRTTPSQLWSCVQLSQSPLLAADRAYGLILPTFWYHCEMSSTLSSQCSKGLWITPSVKKPNPSLLPLGKMKVCTPWTAQNLCFTAFLSLGSSWSQSHSFQWSFQPGLGSSWFGGQLCMPMCKCGCYLPKSQRPVW